jgi:hypothetical protein
MPEYLVTQARKAIFALQAKMKPSLGNISPQPAVKMFDSYILPILEYNCMLWSDYCQSPELEKVQLGYLKNMLNVRRQTSKLAVYAETGRFPLIMRQKILSVNYWARLLKLPSHDILNKCLKIQERLHIKGQSNWYGKIMQIIAEANINNWEHLDINSLPGRIKVNLYGLEQNRILKEINNSDRQPKLRTYKTFKTDYRLEPYLTLNLPKKTYSNIARFRVSSHNLRIETGRHEIPKIPPEERICDKCDNEVEDELHSLLICRKNITARIKLFQKVSEQIPSFFDLDNLEKFRAIMSSKTPEVIHSLGNFLNDIIKIN